MVGLLLLSLSSQGPEQLKKLAPKANATNSRAQKVIVRKHTDCGQIGLLKAAVSNNEEATKVGPKVGQNGEVSFAGCFNEVGKTAKRLTKIENTRLRR